MRLGLRQATLKLGDQWILDAAEFQLQAAERVGLIGLNGAGKTTLLNILMGDSALDQGERIISSGVTIGGVVQVPLLDDSSTVAEVVALGLGETGKAWLKWQHALVSENEDALANAQYDMEHYQAWDVEARIATQLNAWRLSADVRIKGLSGGERKRVALAQAWIAQPEILFLDEPTNHLDLLSIRQLEQAIQDYSGSIICISHDRAFLDAVVTRIIELDRGHLTSYQGNYANYVEQKEKNLEEEALHNAKFDKFLAQEEVWIRKGIEARRTRNEGRVRRLERLREERQNRREIRQMGDNWKLVSGQRSGRQVIVLEDVSYKLPDDRVLLNRFTTRFFRGDRVGIVGPNGVGKSTLLKIILGELAPTEGIVEQGTHLTIAYFDQMREQLDGNQSVLEMISPGSEWIEWNGERVHRIGYLLQFGFNPRQANQPVRSLSGGERQRLLLARLFTQPANVLVLDEPTNDLDMETLDILESTLQRYDGTVFLVTHDRQFLDNVVTQMIVFQPSGELQEYPGGYSDWTFWDDWFKAWDAKKIRLSEKCSSSETVVFQGSNGNFSVNTIPLHESSTVSTVVSSRPLSKKEQEELAQCPRKIEDLENKISLIQMQLADPSLYNQPHDVQKRLTTALHVQLQTLEEQRQAAYARWEILESHQ